MQNRCLKACAAFFAMSLFSFGAAEAATVNISTVADNPHETVHGVRSNTSTYGSDLAGAVVTATYVDGTSETITWEYLNWGVNGGALGAGIDLFMADAGMSMTTTNLLATLSFELAPSSSIFDIAQLNEWEVGNTPTTKIGFPFRVTSGGSALVGAITATYSGIVNLAGRAADGDAYTNMLLDFTGISGPGFAGGFLGTMNWESDMDTLEVAGDLTPTPVPLAASLPFLLAGLGGFGVIRKGRKAA